MTIPKTSTLLPCPFCGSTAHMADTGVVWIACDECDTEGPVKGNEQAAVAAWNTRAAATRDDAMREALAAAKEFADDEFNDCSDLLRKHRISLLCDKIDAVLQGAKP